MLGVFATRLSEALRTGNKEEVARLEGKKRFYSLIAAIYALIPLGLAIYIVKCILFHNQAQNSFEVCMSYVKSRIFVVVYYLGFLTYGLPITLAYTYLALLKPVIVNTAAGEKPDKTADETHSLI